MSRASRYQYVSALDSQAGFDEQLYGALRQSPWWIISIAIHVIVFVVVGMLTTHTAIPAPLELVPIAMTPPLEPEEPDDSDPETRNVQPVETPMPQPFFHPDPVDPTKTIDQELPYADPFGYDGTSTAPLDGPRTNDLIGLGGNAGSLFGNGRGTRGDGGGGGNGATPQSERAVEDALRWLAAHQSPDGGWEAAGFHRWCDRRAVAQGPDGLGAAHYDAGVTGLATLAFLGAGYTHRGHHPFAKTVRNALRYLRNIQDAEGCFGPRTSQHFIYNHACAAMAMVEAYGMTESSILRGSAQKSLEFIAIARNPYFAWRYGVKAGDNDTSVTGWMMMALKSAGLINRSARERGKDGPLQIDEEAFDGIRAWIDKMTDPDTGRVGYVQRGQPPARPEAMIDRFPSDKSESMTAVGVLARIFIGEDPRRSEPVKRGAALCARTLPVWNETNGSIDMYYWYYATLAMFQVGGESWRSWNGAMQSAIVDHQRQDTDFCMYKGSWDPVGPWGGDGGRVYATALMAMCLEVYYRYDRVGGTRR